MAEYYLSQHTERPILILLSPSFRAKINIKLKKPSLLRKKCYALALFHVSK